MKLLKFEIKKLVKQKKYLWLILVVFLSIGALFSLNTYQRSRLQGNWATFNALNDFRPLTEEWDRRETELIILRDEGKWSYEQEKQLEYSRDIGRSLIFLRGYTSFDRWEEITQAKERFLIAIENFTAAGGEFSALEGVERKAAIAKNSWMLEHHIHYEYEGFPISQHLFLKQVSSILLGIVGLGILLFLFGNSITEEKEQKTWLTIKVQPISKLKLIISKYVGFMAMSILFTVLVISIGFLIPGIVNGRTLNLQYPNVLIIGETFSIMTTEDYLIRSIALFICASSLLASISFIASKLVDRSFSLYILVSIVGVLGYLATSWMDTPLNPFYLLNFANVQSIDLIYYTSTFSWSVFLLLLAAFLPDTELKTMEIVKNNKPFDNGITKTWSNVLRNLYTFEWRKLVREGLVIIFFLTIIVIVVGGYALVTSETTQRKEMYFNELQYRIDEGRRIILENTENVEKLRQENPRENLEEIHTLRQEIAHYQARINNINRAIDGYSEGRWSAIHQYQFDVNREAYGVTYWLDEPTGGGWGSKTGVETLGRFGKMASMNEKRWMLKYDIQPVFSGDFLPTLFRNWGRHTRIGFGGERVTQLQWEWENTKVDNSGLFFLYLAYTRYAYFVPLLLLFFLLGGGIAKERGKRPTFNFLKAQPITGQKIYFAKIFSSFAIGVIAMLAILFLALLVGTVYSRFGDWNYPVIHYNTFKDIMSPDYTGFADGGRGYHFITLARYLLNSTLLLLSVTWFIMGVSIFLSLFIKEPIGVYGTTLITMAIGYYRNWRLPFDVSYRSPFTYFRIPRIVNGEMAARLNEPRFNVTNGVLVLLGSAALMMLASCLIINREKKKKKLFNFTTSILARGKISWGGNFEIT